MTRYVVDTGAVLHLIATEQDAHPDNELLAPTLLRSQTLSALHGAVHRGELTAAVAKARLKQIGQMKIRLLGDAVLRRHAWKVADELRWPSTFAAEYVALTLLQADALVTTDPEMEAQARTLVATAPVSALCESTG